MIIAIPEVLREKLGPQGARALAELLNEASVRTRGDVIEIAASRFERRLAEEIGALRGEIGALRGDLTGEIGRAEGRITRWMFVFWVGQIGVITAIFFAFLQA